MFKEYWEQDTPLVVLLQYCGDYSSILAFSAERQCCRGCPFVKCNEDGHEV